LTGSGFGKTIPEPHPLVREAKMSFKEVGGYADFLGVGTTECHEHKQKGKE